MEAPTMTEYQLADLFATWSIIQEETVQRFIGLLFAFLIAAYLVSAKLKPAMVGIVLLLYSYMAIRYVLFYLNIADDIIYLADEIMHLRDQPNSHLIWLSISPNISILLYSQAVAMFLSYIASIVFFFYNRRDPVNNLEHLAQGGI